MHETKSKHIHFPNIDRYTLNQLYIPLELDILEISTYILFELKLNEKADIPQNLLMESQICKGGH